MTLTLEQNEAIVERVAKAVLYRHGLQFCKDCSSIRMVTVEKKEIILSIANNLSPQGREVSRKIQEEVLKELLKRFSDVRIMKDSEAWQFRIHVV